MRRPSVQEQPLTIAAAGAFSSMSSTPPEPIVEVPESERGDSHFSEHTGMDWAAEAMPTSYNPSEASLVTPQAVVEQENEANRAQEQRVLGNAESTQRLLLRCDEFDAWKALMDAFYARIAEDERQSSRREAHSSHTSISHHSHKSHRHHHNSNNDNSAAASASSRRRRGSQAHSASAAGAAADDGTLVAVSAQPGQSDATPSPTPAVHKEEAAAQANNNNNYLHTNDAAVHMALQSPPSSQPRSYGTAPPPSLGRASLNVDTTYGRNGSAEQVLRQFFWPLTILSAPPRSSFAPSSPRSPAPSLVNDALSEDTQGLRRVPPAQDKDDHGSPAHAHGGTRVSVRSSHNDEEQYLYGYGSRRSRSNELPALQDVRPNGWAFATLTDRLMRSPANGYTSTTSGAAAAAASHPTVGNNSSNNNSDGRAEANAHYAAIHDAQGHTVADKAHTASGNDFITTSSSSSSPSSPSYYYWQSLWVNSVTRQYLFFLLSFLYLGAILVHAAVWTMVDVFAAAPLPLYRNSHTTASTRNAWHATALFTALSLTLMIFAFTDGVALMRSARWPQALLLLGPTAVMAGVLLIYHGGLRAELGITLAGAAVYGVGIGLALLAACMLSFVEVGVAAGMVAQLNITLLSFVTVNALAYLVLPTLYNSAVTSERTVLKGAIYMTAVSFLYAAALLLLVPRTHIARAAAANDRYFRTRRLFVAVRHVSGRFVLRTLAFACVFSLVVLAADNAAVLFAPLPSLMTSRRPSRFVTLDAATRSPSGDEEDVSAHVVLTTLGAQRVAAMLFVSAFMLWPLCFLPRLSSVLARSGLLLVAVMGMAACWAVYATLPGGRRMVASAMWYMACTCASGAVLALLASSLLRSLLRIGESTWVMARRANAGQQTGKGARGETEKVQRDARPAADEHTALLPNSTRKNDEGTATAAAANAIELRDAVGPEAASVSAQGIELHDGPSAVVSLGVGVLLSSLVVCTVALAVTSMLLRREMTPAAGGAANAAVVTLRAQLALKRMMLGLSVAAVLCEGMQTVLHWRAAL